MRNPYTMMHTEAKTLRNEATESIRNQIAEGIPENPDDMILMLNALRNVIEAQHRVIRKMVPVFGVLEL